MLLVIAFSFVFGTFLAFSAILGPLFSPLGFDSTEISLFGILALSAGMVSSILAGALVQKYHNYKLMLLISTWGTAGCFFLAIFTYSTKNLGLIIANTFATGFLMLPIIPIGMNFC